MGRAAERVLNWKPPPPSPLSNEFQAKKTPPVPGSSQDVTMQEGTPTASQPSSVRSNVKPYVPSLPSGNADSLSQYVAKLSGEQRESITQLISATKEPLSVAIDTLIACEWDLLEAIAIFGGDARDEDDDDDGTRKDLHKQTYAPLGTRYQGGTAVRNWCTGEERKQYQEEYSTITQRVVLLRHRFYSHNQDWPQNPRNAVSVPITLRLSPSSPNTHTIKFMSPHGDRKLWYTGFMEP